MAVLEEDLQQIEAAKQAAIAEIESARRAAVRQVIREMDAEGMIDNLLSFPERIRKQQEAYAAAKQAVLEAEGEIQVIESALMAEIAEDKAFSNDTKRRAELVKRKSASPEFQAAQQALNAANEALRKAQFDLERLQNEFSALRHATDFKRELFRALVN